MKKLIISKEQTNSVPKPLIKLKEDNVSLCSHHATDETNVKQ